MKATTLVLVPVPAAAGCEGGPSPAAPAAHATVVRSSVALGDPHIVSDSVNRLNILFSLYEALVAIDEHGGHQPGLAQRWSVADDARTWTFTLRKGVAFDNGDTLRAADVVASIRRTLDPAISGAFGTTGVPATYLGTDEVEALDESTVRIVGIEGKSRLAAAGGATAHERESGLCIILMLNALNGPCKDRRVRQALNYALDVDAIIAEVMNGGATRLNGYLTANHFGYDPETLPYPHDPDKARRLLAEAGCGKGLTLVFDIPSAMPDEAPALTRMMAEQYRQVGITVKVVEHGDRAAYSEMVRDKKINDACCFDNGLDPSPGRPGAAAPAEAKEQQAAFGSCARDAADV